MKIALVSSCAAPVPPRAYGGIERFVGELAKALAARGHTLVVYATGDSRPPGRLRYLYERPVWPPDYHAELEHARFAWREIETLEPDVVHLNVPDALLPSAGHAFPILATLHTPRVEHLVAIYGRFRDAHLVAISRHQAATMPELGALPVIHHGLDPADYPYGEGDGGYCAFLGRIGPEKAPHLAIDAALEAHVPLVIGGPHWSGRAYYDEYFAREFAPRLAQAGEAVRWLGELDMQAKLALLSRAQALLMPMAWEEPFGLVMIEAMLTGTPVVAYAKGSAPELVEPGTTGLLVSNVSEMAAALRQARRIDRRACRERAIARFGLARMAAEYEAVYRRLRASAPLTTPAA